MVRNQLPAQVVKRPGVITNMFAKSHTYLWCICYGGTEEGGKSREWVVCWTNLETDLEHDSTFSCFLITNPTVRKLKRFWPFTPGLFWSIFGERGPLHKVQHA